MSWYLCKQQKHSLVILLILVLGVSGVSALEKSKPTGVFFEPLEVPLVSLEVFVSDSQGKPVPGLTPDDFQVLEDGEPVEITHFYAAKGVAQGSITGLESTETDRAMLSAPSQSLFLVVYCDETNFTRSRRVVALENLRRFFESDLPEDMRVMIVSYNGALNVKQQLTDEREQLLVALDDLKDDASLDYGMMQSALIREVQRNANATLSESTQLSTTGISSDQSMELAIADSALREIESFAKERRQRSIQNLNALRSLVRSLSGLPGRKAVFYLSNGIVMSPGEDLFRVWELAFPTLALERGINPTFAAKRYSIVNEVRDVVEYANAYRVSFYTLSSVKDSLLAFQSAESTGIDGTSGLEILTWSEEEAFIHMTSGTGGRALANNQALSEHLAEVAVELGSYYSLGYHPRDESDDGYHRIKVKVDRKGIKVRHREGYHTKSINERMADRTLSAAIHGVIENPLGVSLDTNEHRREDDGTYTVPILIKVPLDQIVLLPQQYNHQGRISVFVVVRDQKGGLSGVEHRQYPVEIPNEQLHTALTQQAGFIIGLRMRAGEQVVAVGVRDELSNVAATVTLDVNIEDEGDSEKSDKTESVEIAHAAT